MMGNKALSRLDTCRYLALSRDIVLSSCVTVLFAVIMFYVPWLLWYHNRSHSRTRQSAFTLTGCSSIRVVFFTSVKASQFYWRGYQWRHTRHLPHCCCCCCHTRLVRHTVDPAAKASRFWWHATWFQYEGDSQQPETCRVEIRRSSRGC